MEKLTLIIKGLDCAEEVGALKATVGKLDGIEHLDFNLLNGTMSVTFSDARLNEEQIITAVWQAGLKAQPYQAGIEEEQGFWEQQGRKMMCSLSGILGFAGFALHAILHQSVFDALSGEGGGVPLPSALLYLGAVVSGG